MHVELQTVEIIQNATANVQMSNVQITCAILTAAERAIEEAAVTTYMFYTDIYKPNKMLFKLPIYSPSTRVACVALSTMLPLHN